MGLALRARGSQGSRLRRETINLCAALPNLPCFFIFPESLGGQLGGDCVVFFADGEMEPQRDHDLPEVTQLGGK